MVLQIFIIKRKLALILFYIITNKHNLNGQYIRLAEDKSFIFFSTNGSKAFEFEWVQQMVRWFENCNIFLFTALVSLATSSTCFEFSKYQHKVYFLLPLRQFVSACNFLLLQPSFFITFPIILGVITVASHINDLSLTYLRSIFQLTSLINLCCVDISYSFVFLFSSSFSFRFFFDWTYQSSLLISSIFDSVTFWWMLPLSWFALEQWP